MPIVVCGFRFWFTRLVKPRVDFLGIFMVDIFGRHFSGNQGETCKSRGSNIRKSEEESGILKIQPRIF